MVVVEMSALSFCNSGGEAGSEYNFKSDGGVCLAGALQNALILP